MRQQGFTLLEVLIAMAVFAIGILAVSGMQFQVVSGNAKGNIQTQQMMLAQRVMEQVKNAPIISSPTGNNKVNDLVGVDEKGESGGPYNVDVSTSNPLGGATSRFIQVRVSKGGGITGHDVVLLSLSHGNGI